MHAIGQIKQLREPVPQHDFCDKAGALLLKARIEAYWKEHGGIVPDVTIKNVGFHPSMRTARYEVASNLVNGLPRAIFLARLSPLREGKAA